MDARIPERLVRVDVPDAGNGALVQKRSLHGCPPTGEGRGKALRGEPSLQRLSPEPPTRKVRVQVARLEEIPGAESPNVSIDDVRAVV
jgi:hypothetical protein